MLHLGISCLIVLIETCSDEMKLVTKVDIWTLVIVSQLVLVTICGF